MAYSTDTGKAREFALAHHGAQVDKAGKPYSGHLERVAARVQLPEAQVIAWLHDTIEDTGASYEELAREFGEDTAQAVRTLTHRENEAYMDYIMRVRDVPVARAVKIADLIDNSNLSRLSVVTRRDVARQAKYNAALAVLLDKTNG